MGPRNHCLAPMARLGISSSLGPLAPTRTRLVAPATQVRWASAKKRAAEKAAKQKRMMERMKFNKKQENEASKTVVELKNPDPTKAPQFSLCDAIRHHRAIEVGKRPLSVLYEVAIRVHSLKPGTQPISGTIMLPHPIASKITTAVICPEGSEIAKQALEAGAVLVGEESMFAKIREGQTNFQRLLVHDSSEINFNRARLGPILGPKGLMPSRKRGTITANIKKELASQTRLFRERTGVIRLPIGYMTYTPKMVAENLKAIVDEVKDMAGRMGGQQNVKKIMEVVLSSSHGPGFSLNGRFLPSDRDVSDKDLAGPM